MNKNLKNFIVGIVTTAVVSSALFCCCFLTPAQASVGVKAEAACCDNESTHPAQQEKSCDCGLKKLGIAEYASFSSSLVSAVFNIVSVPPTIWTFAQTQRIAAIKTDYGGSSPGGTGQGPLYLRFCTFRI